MYGIGAGKIMIAVTEKKEIIADAINMGTERGCTFLEAKGAYKNEPKSVLMCACYKRQVMNMKNIIYLHDPKAFVIIV